MMHNPLLLRQCICNSIILTFTICFCFFFSAQLLRVQSPEGTKRIELLPSATIRELYEAIHDAFELDSYNFGVYGERNYKNELGSSRSQTVDDYKLKHGDMIYMKPLSVGSSTVSSRIPIDF